MCVFVCVLFSFDFLFVFFLCILKKLHKVMIAKGNMWQWLQYSVLEKIIMDILHEFLIYILC